MIKIVIIHTYVNNIWNNNYSVIIMFVCLHITQEASWYSQKKLFPNAQNRYKDKVNFHKLMQIDGLDYTQAPCNKKIWFVTSYSTIISTKIKCDVPVDDWIAPELAHKHFKCDGDYKPFKGRKVKMSQSTEKTKCNNLTRGRAFDPEEALMQIVINFKNWYWTSFMRIETPIKTNEEYFKRVSRLFKGKCLPKFFSMITLIVRHLFEQKEKIRINNLSILQNPNYKKYDSSDPDKQWTFSFKDEFFWSKHVGGYQLLSPPPEVFSDDFDHAKSLEFLGVKYVFIAVIVSFVVCIFYCILFYAFNSAAKHPKYTDGKKLNKKTKKKSKNNNTKMNDNNIKIENIYHESNQLQLTSGQKQQAKEKNIGYTGNRFEFNNKDGKNCEAYDISGNCRTSPPSVSRPTNRNYVSNAFGSSQSSDDSDNSDDTINSVNNKDNRNQISQIQQLCLRINNIIVLLNDSSLLFFCVL